MKSEHEIQSHEAVPEFKRVNRYKSKAEASAATAVQFLTDDKLALNTETKHSSIAPRTNWPQRSDDQWKELKDIDLVFASPTTGNWIYGLHIAGCGCEAFTGDIVVGVSPDAKTQKRARDFMESRARLHSVGIPVDVWHSHIAQGGYRVIATRLIGFFETECRRINPDHRIWDYLIQTIRRKYQLVHEGGQKPNLVDAGQLTLQLEHS